jgi:anti-sigma-K factor RskA
MTTPPYDVHALSGAYAVDALDDAERAAFEAHLAECAACRAEVAGLQEAAGMIAATTTTTPPPELRDRVLADIATVRPLPPEAPAEAVGGGGAVVPLAPRAHRFSTRTSRVLAAAAAAVVLAVGGAVVAQSPWEHHSISATEAVLDAPDARSTSVDFPHGATATLTHSDELGRAVIVVHHMPAPPRGRVYQLWLDQPGRGMVSAGLMPSGSSDATLLLAGDATTATAAGITVEPEGGSLAPTSKPIALFDFGAKA